MDQGFSFSRRPGVLLFDEDFDQPPPRPKPEVVEPVYTEADLRAAREEAAREARDLAMAEVDASSQAASRVALIEIGRQIEAARAEAMSSAEQSAEAMARLLLDCFASAFPALSARHGPGEVMSLVRAILPVLQREHAITVHVNPHIVETLTTEIRTMDSEVLSRVRIVPTDAIARGDARIAWQNGDASRDAASLWKQIETALSEAGLMRPEQTAKEYEVVQ